MHKSNCVGYASHTAIIMFKAIVCVYVQAQLKEMNLSADEATRAKEEQAAKLRDMEKKVRTLEQDLNQAQEVSVLTV